MSTSVIGLGVEIQLDNVLAELKRLEPGMAKEAKAMTAALGKEVRAQTRALTQVTEAAKKVGTEIKAGGEKASQGLGAAGAQATNLRFQLFDVIQQVSAGQNPMMILNQQGFQIAQAFDGAASKASVFKAAIAPLISAVTTFLPIVLPLATGIGVVAANMHESARAAASSKRAYEALFTSWKDTQALVGDNVQSLIDLKAKTGMVNAEDAVRAKALDELTTKYAEQLVAIEAEEKALKYAAGSHGKERIALRDQKIALTEATKEKRLFIEAEYEFAKATRESNEFIDERDKRLKKAEDAAKELKEWQDKLTKTWGEESARIHGVNDAIKDLEAASAKSAASRLEGGEAILAALALEVGGLEAVRDEGLKNARSDEERAHLYQAYMDAKVTATVTAEEKIRELVEETDKKRSKELKKQADEYDEFLAKRAEETKSAWNDVANTSSAMFGTVSNYLADQADEMAKSNKKAAKSMFAASQAAALAEAGMNIALGITQGLTLPPPADAVKVAAVVATGAIQVATIAGAKPSFHAGTGLYKDETNSTLLNGEAVLNRPAAQQLGPQAINAMNAGQSLGGVTVLKIGRREAREIARTDIKSNGMIPTTAKKYAKRNGRPAGSSGRRPIA